MPDTIRPASTQADYEAFAGLVRDYVEWCRRRRYQGDAWLIDRTLGHQSLDRELDSLSVAYGPPNGRAFLARSEDEVCGCGAYRRLGPEICEMKRLFVPDRFRGRGIGKKLCDAFIAAAQSDGFSLMRLDTTSRMTEAIAMYRAIGFRPCAPYHDYPDELMPSIVFMDLPLAKP